MSERQATLIENLLKERNLSSLTAEQRDFLASGAWRTVEQHAAASRIITALLELPRNATQSRSLASPSTVAEGYYAVEIGGALRFFRVNRPTDGRWAGRLFLDEIIGGDRRRPIREHREMNATLDAIGADQLNARVRYGREIGSCGYCNRGLTDETSRICGIGPDCARRHDVDREAIVASLLVEA